MNHSVEGIDVELIWLIVNYGLGSKIIKSAKQYGVTGGTITRGKGTANSRLLDFIGLSDIRKEVVYMVGEKDIAYQALEELNKEYEFYKPNHGIAFTTSICGVIGTKSIRCESNESNNVERGVDETMYHMITTIVDRGKAEEVITAANRAGARGGTVINARGSGIHETTKLFAMDIEPEKEMVVILCEKDMTEAIVSSIRNELQIDEPGKGIIYIQNVNKTYGIRK